MTPPPGGNADSNPDEARMRIRAGLRDRVVVAVNRQTPFLSAQVKADLAETVTEELADYFREVFTDL